MRMLELHHRFGSAISLLLAEVSTNGAAAMMPYQRRRGVGDFHPRIQESPADIHIIAGLAEPRIEPAQSQQGLATKCHVAAGHMLSIAIVDHHVAWISRAGRDALRHPMVRWRR